MNAFLIPIGQGSDPIYRGKLGDTYVQFVWLGVILAAGASFALFTLEPIGKRKLSVAFYLFLLALLLPFSLANYIKIDLWTERLRQGIFDIVLVLLGLTAIHRLVTYQVISILAGIARGIAVFLLAAACVMIPAIYAFIWFFNIADVAKAAAHTHGFRPNWISGVSLVVAAGFAIFIVRTGVRPGPR